MSPMRCDAEGARAFGQTWESLAERLIREAQERGEFDDLPGHGKRLRIRQNPWAGEKAVGYSLLENAHVAPPWTEADKEVRRLVAERDGLMERAARGSPLMRRTFERQLTDLVTQHNQAVEQLNAEAPTPRQHRRRLILADELAALAHAAEESEALSEQVSSGHEPGGGSSEAGRRSTGRSQP